MSLFFYLLLPSQMLKLQLYTTIPSFYSMVGIELRAHFLLGRQVLSTELPTDL